MSITILNPGTLTSVQDLGRIGYQQYGVSVSGVMDPRSASIANILVDNDEGEAVLDMERVSKRNYYLDIAQTVLERATCLRRVYGAIIVKNDEIISTGYNGAPRGGSPARPCSAGYRFPR